MYRLAAGSTRETRPVSPPTSGCFRANQAAAKEPAIAMPNWMKSVTRTPQSPEVAAKATFSTAADEQRLPHRPSEDDVWRSSQRRG